MSYSDSQRDKTILIDSFWTNFFQGPITNMGLNAKEVVRVYACSTQLSYNLSKTRYSLMSAPFKRAIFDLRTEVSQIKDTIRSAHRFLRNLSFLIIHRWFCIIVKEADYSGCLDKPRVEGNKCYYKGRQVLVGSYR